MKRTQTQAVISIVAMAVFALITGCASAPSAEVVADEFRMDLADSKP